MPAFVHDVAGTGPALHHRWQARLERAFAETTSREQSSGCRAVRLGRDMTSRWLRAALVAAALGASACGSASEPEVVETAIPLPSECNGHAELCSRTFDQVVFPGAHNAMSNFDEGWAVANQQHGLTRQLEDGIRVMLIDTHYWQDDAYLCHRICELGHTLLVDGLREIKVFMDAHPYEVLTLIIEDGITAEDTEKAFRTSGLIEDVYVHEPGTPWPTLRDMIVARQRLLVTAESGGSPPAWYQNVWGLTWDTPYTFRNEDELSCDLNRGTKGNDLFLMNHWIEDPLPTPEHAAVANAHELLSGRAKQCIHEGGQLTNFIAVDFYSTGDLFRVVDELNGVE